MSDSKTCPQSGLSCQTLVSLREYIEAKLIAQEKALLLQERELERRLSALNEYRDQAKDEARRYATRIEVAALREQIDDLKRSRDEMAGKASGTQVLIATIIAFAALVISALGLVLR